MVDSHWSVTGDAKNHWQNKARKELFELSLDDLYVVSGTYGGNRDFRYKEDVGQYLLQNVEVRPYDTSTRYEDLPVLATCEYLQCIRKKQGMEHYKLTEGNTYHFIGKLYSYERNIEGLERRSFKIFRDSGVGKELGKCEKRIRNLEVSWMSINNEERLVRISVTQRIVERVQTILEDWMFLAFKTKKEYETQLMECEKELERLKTIALN